MAEIRAVVGRKQRDAVGLEVVKRVRERFDGAVGIREAGQRGEEAEFGGLGGAQGCGVVIPAAGEGAAGGGGAGGGGAGDFGAGGGEGEDGGCDGEGGHEGGGSVEAPRLDGGAGDVAGGGEGGAVEFGEGVVVDVDFAGHVGKVFGVLGGLLVCLCTSEVNVVRLDLLLWFFLDSGHRIFIHDNSSSSTRAPYGPDVFGTLIVPQNVPYTVWH